MSEKTIILCLEQTAKRRDVGWVWTYCKFLTVYTKNVHELEQVVTLRTTINRSDWSHCFVSRPFLRKYDLIRCKNGKRIFHNPLKSDQIFLPFWENRMTVVSLPFFFFLFSDIAKLTNFSTRWQKDLGSKYETVFCFLCLRKKTRIRPSVS